MKELRFANQVELLEEPRVHKRFWNAERRARYAAKVILNMSPETPPDPFVLIVAPGIGFNVTSSGCFVIGHLASAVTSFSKCLLSR